MLRKLERKKLDDELDKSIDHANSIFLRHLKPQYNYKKPLKSLKFGRFVGRLLREPHIN